MESIRLVRKVKRLDNEWEEILGKTKYEVEGYGQARRLNECNKLQRVMQKRRKFVLHLLFQNVLPGINLRRIIPYIKNKKRRTEVSIYPLETTEIQTTVWI
jgi:hypothetical protein